MAFIAPKHEGMVAQKDTPDAISETSLSKYRMSDLGPLPVSDI